MKRSPCCKVCCIFSFVYLLTLLLGTILVITAKYGSGMFGQTHYVSFKIAMDSTNLWRFKTHKTMHGFDDVANQSYSQFVYEQDENGTYINVVPENRSAQQFFQLELNQDTDMMLMAVLFNGTAGWQDSQAKIKSFTIANQSDRGKIIMSVSNNDKIWMEIFQPWFNLDFWTSKVAELLPPKSHSIFQGNSGIQRAERIYNESYSNSLYNYSEIWHPVPFTEENSNIPVWFVNMEAVVITSTGSQQKSEDYSVTFRFGDRFCFSPFLIRDFRYQLLTIENVDLCGNLIVDFTGETENVSVKVSNSSVDFLLTRLEKSYTFELGKGSTINITLPDLIS